ncbi:Glycoside hydrolase family 12 [Macrophomina phaseolina MS6]|uniref:Glycoside hydrolase family 12 n=1 Tax=Macrophomina phaseolina (strain MS6) TaxID=1126212 RepID=K2RSF5_MACPH|nr:Glycoside hydrolase family 12 [Macrophomina phaseolina MS6]
MPSFKSSSMQAMLALAASATALPTFSSMQKRQASQSPANLCGMPDDSLILSGTPWIVYNMMYNSAQIEGTACTGYVGTTTDANGNQAVKWNSTWNIEYVQSTDNVPKGYSFVGLTQNLESRISDIGSIPTTYEWTRTNTTAYKGNVCYDFMTSDTKGDSTSSNAQELMLWLQYDGGQLPIGWTAGAVATIDNLYGTSWKLYQGKNDDTGITVSSLLPDTQFDGSFSGDIKDWLEALVKQGLFTETEPFYGDCVLDATLALQVNLGSDTTAESVTPISSVVPTSTAAPSSTEVPASTKVPASAETPPPSSSSSSTPAATPSSSAATFVLPSSSSTITVESTELPTSTPPTTLASTLAAPSSAANGADSIPSSSIEAPASNTTLPATPSSPAPTPAISTPATPTPSAADPVSPTGNYGPPSSFSGFGNDGPAPTPGSGVSGDQGQSPAPGEGEDDEGPCAVEYIYV